MRPKSGEYFATVDPATGTTLAEVAQAGEKDVDAAVRAARQAQPEWWGLGGHGRARYLYAIARHVQKHHRLLAVLESLDNGKPIRETRDIDVPLVARHFYHHAGWAQLLERELPGYVPVGVVGQIIPWNFPLLMLAWKIAPALATGNTVVLKPAEFTPLTALAFAEICQEVGLPPGVVNIVTGDGRTGEALVRHPDVDKIAFTGSTEVGRLIRAATAGSGKKLSLELGGKSPFVVFDDADLDSAVEGVVDAIWFNQGQVCCAGSRLLLQEGIAEAMVRKLEARMERLRVGDPLDKAIDIGAIVAPVQLEKIRTLVARGVEEGARCWQPSWAVPTEGCFYPPTLFTDVAPASTVAQVEIFGPVLVAMTFRTPDEAVELANNTRYGLAASVWSENLNLALDVAPKLTGGRRLGQLHQPVRRGLRLRRLPRERLRPRGRPRGALRVPGAEVGEGAAGLSRLARCHHRRAAHRGAGARGGAADRPHREDVRRRQAGAPRRRLQLPGAAAPAVRWSARRRSATARTCATPSRRRARRPAGPRPPATCGRRSSTTSPRTWRRAGEELAHRLETLTGQSRRQARREVATSVERLFTYAAWADKYDGAVHHTPRAQRHPRHARADRRDGHRLSRRSRPLLGFVSLVAPAVAMGNRVVAVPSTPYPLAATDLYQVFDTSDLPAGVVNIVTGPKDELAQHPRRARRGGGDLVLRLARGRRRRSRRASAGNLKQTWTLAGRQRDWYDPQQAEGEELLAPRHPGEEHLGPLRRVASHLLHSPGPRISARGGAAR